MLRGMRHPRLRLAALEAFRHAAATGGFQAAGAALGITPSAVSHQIRALEAALGVSLFTRGVRSVILTEAGRALAAATETAFAGLDAAVATLRAVPAGTRLRVSALPLFTNAWLIPRLPGFEAAHPGIAIEIDTSNRLADIAAGEADIGIRNVNQPGPGLAARKLLDLRAVPLCAPALAAVLTAPAELADHVLIHHSGRPHAWETMLAALGVAGLSPHRSISFDTLPAALEAAMLGHGVALGIAPLVWDAIAPERLVVPFAALPMVSAGAYFVVHRRERTAAVSAFVEWVVGEMGRKF